MRALVKDGTVSGEGDLIHQHGQGPFMHPKLALHLAQWANPAFASVVNGWVLRYIAADRSLADDVLRRAGAGGGGEALLGSSLTHTMREVPLLPDSQPQAGEEEKEEEDEDDHPFLPSMEATASDAAAPSKAPSAQRSRQPAQAKALPPPQEEEEPAEEEPAPTPVETPAPRRQRARTGAKTTATPARLAKAKTGRRRRAHRKESFKIYIHKVLKQISPTLGISSKAMAVMDNMMSDMFEGLASEAALLMRKDNGRTLTAREMAAAVKMRFNGDLRAHAMSEGAKARRSCRVFAAPSRLTLGLARRPSPSSTAACEHVKHRATTHARCSRRTLQTNAPCACQPIRFLCALQASMTTHVYDSLRSTQAATR